MEPREDQSPGVGDEPGCEDRERAPREDPGSRVLELQAKEQGKKPEEKRGDRPEHPDVAAESEKQREEEAVEPREVRRTSDVTRE